MITRKELLTLIQAKLDDADALLAAGRYDGAIYLCGYAVELVIKLRICKTLRWDKFPYSGNKSYENLKTHKLDILLSFSGYEKKIRKDATTFTAWNRIRNWDPESRYTPPTNATQANAQRMINAAKIIVGAFK